MIAIFLLFVVAFVVLNAAHLTLAAWVCLVLGLLVLHPVRAVVMFCLAGVISLIIAAVELVLPRHRRDRLEALPVRYPPNLGRGEPGPRPRWRPGKPRPERPAPEPVTWQGQASPFLDRRGRHL